MAAGVILEPEQSYLDQLGPTGHQAFIIQHLDAEPLPVIYIYQNMAYQGDVISHIYFISISDFV